MCVIPARDAAPMFSGVQIPPPTPIRSVNHVTSIPILSRVTRTFLPAGFFPEVPLPGCAAASAARSLAHSFATAAKSRAPGLGPALRCRGFGSFYGILLVFAVAQASLRLHSGIRPAVDSLPFSPPESAPALFAARVAGFVTLLIETIGPCAQFSGSIGKPIRLSSV